MGFLKHKFNWASCILFGNLAGKSNHNKTKLLTIYSELQRKKYTSRELWSCLNAIKLTTCRVRLTESKDSYLYQQNYC